MLITTLVALFDDVVVVSVPPEEETALPESHRTKPFLKTRQTGYKVFSAGDLHFRAFNISSNRFVPETEVDHHDLHRFVPVCLADSIHLGPGMDLVALERPISWNQRSGAAETLRATDTRFRLRQAIVQNYHIEM